MPDQWMLRGAEFSNCNCDYSCPCQFNAPTSNGFCEAVVGGVIEEGHFNDVRLDGLTFCMLFQWPGEVAEGDGKQQAIIDERADDAQREALRKILHGESTAPGATHFFVFNSTMSEVLPTLFAPVKVNVDIEARRASVEVPGQVESRGEPIMNPHTGTDHRVRINLPNGFEYTTAEIGRGFSKAAAGISITLDDSYGQFNILHMNQDGVIR